MKINREDFFMSENNFENNNDYQSFEQKSEETNEPQNSSSGIRYTYNPNGSSSSQGYNTDINNTPKKKSIFAGNGCFITLIAVLLCITVGAAGISLYTLFSSTD